jgi:Amt family ammonium transporter
MFQMVFCATAATIVSGAMAERTKFISYCIYSFIISAVIYPVSGHWIWGGGWLAELGFHDFAGSTAVHMVGGVAALVGAKILGPRIGKFKKDGTARAIPGHSLTLGALGVFILWFCWFGFNGASTVSMTGDLNIVSAGAIFVKTNIAAAAAAIVVMILTWIRYKKPDVSMTLNGALAGLVALTAGCDAVSAAGACIIGVISAFAVTYGIEFVEKVLKIDDPVGAIGVHGICGALGTICVGLFAIDGGLFYGGGAGLLGAQALGVAAVAAWVAVTMTALFIVLKKTVGLRVSREEELAGLDIEEHGIESSYADFMPAGAALNFTKALEDGGEIAAPESAVPVVRTDSPAGGRHKMTKVTIITRQSKFEALKAAADEIGITGITVTQVLGAGMQRGREERYRGVPLEITLLPKLKVDLVVC